VWLDDDGLVLSYVHTHFVTQTPRRTH
jgi:hypothetical protein